MGWIDYLTAGDGTPIFYDDQGNLVGITKDHNPGGKAVYLAFIAYSAGDTIPGGVWDYTQFDQLMGGALAEFEVASPPVVNLVGDLSLSEFAELVNHAAAVLTGDSFPLHVAAANGRPTVALFGPTDETRVGPISDSTVIIRAESANCSRCYRRTYCPKACIRKIRPVQIYQALQQVTEGVF